MVGSNDFVLNKALLGDWYERGLIGRGQWCGDNKIRLLALLRFLFEAVDGKDFVRSPNLKVTGQQPKDFAASRISTLCRNHDDEE